MRLDKWLWIARFFKTRALATKAIQQGKVLYDNQKAKASREIKIGASLTIKSYITKTVIVKFFATQRQSAVIAESLYEETLESILQREEEQKKYQANKLFVQSAPKPSRKPEKKSRLKIRELRRKE